MKSELDRTLEDKTSNVHLFKKTFMRKSLMRSTEEDPVAVYFLYIIYTLRMRAKIKNTGSVKRTFEIANYVMKKSPLDVVYYFATTKTIVFKCEQTKQGDKENFDVTVST